MRPKLRADLCVHSPVPKKNLVERVLSFVNVNENVRTREATIILLIELGRPDFAIAAVAGVNRATVLAIRTRLDGINTATRQQQVRAAWAHLLELWELLAEIERLEVGRAAHQ